MRKAEQIKENELVEQAIERMTGTPTDFRRLRTMSASVAETDDWYFLWSYRTNVAAIEKSTGICYDFLRKVYGYTATSAKHIAAFRNDYHARNSYTWREV